jgi:hypothetical protein
VPIAAPAGKEVAADEVASAKSPPHPPAHAPSLDKSDVDDVQQASPTTDMSPVSIEANVPTVNAKSVEVAWKDNSCCIDASIVALYTAVGGIRTADTVMTVREVRERFFAQMSDPSLGEPLTYGVHQDVQAVMQRLCRMCGVATHIELEFCLRASTTDMSDACKVSVHAPRTTSIDSIVVAGVRETMTECIKERIDCYAQKSSCIGFNEVHFRTPAKYMSTLHTNVWVDVDAAVDERQAFRKAHLHITGKPMGETYQCDTNVKCGDTSGVCHGMCSFRCRQTVETKAYHFSVTCSGQRWYNAAVTKAADVLIVHVTPIPGANAKMMSMGIQVGGAGQLYSLRSVIQKSGEEGDGHFRTIFACPGFTWYVHDGLRNKGKPTVYPSGWPVALTSPKGSLKNYYDVALVYVRAK